MPDKMRPRPAERNARLPELLEPEEERALVDRALQGDRTARAALIEHHLRTVERVTKKYRNIGMEAEDRFSVGCLALIYAVDHYDPSSRMPLTAYIRMAVKGRMLNEVRDGRPDRENVVSSLDAPLRGLNGEPGDTLGELIAGRGRDALERVIEHELYRSIWNAVKALPEELRRVISMRYGGMRVLSQREVAMILGCGQITVSRRERAALAMCRKQMRRKVGQGMRKDGQE